MGHAALSVFHLLLGGARPDTDLWRPDPPTMTSWRQHGACRGLDPAIFYPLDDDDAEPAQEVCAVCPVQAACLEHALATREKEGVWGGATERERRRIIRQRRRTA